MENYYELLEIEKGADEQSIKRAYFNMVRKYPPESFPDEFKKLRKAFETLSKPNERADYDKRIGLPEGAMNLYEMACSAKSGGQKTEALTLMKSLAKKYPKEKFLQKELATWYEEEEKFGNAIKIWEKFVSNEPNSCEYVIRLADAYRMRQWNKKALAMYNKALDMDNSQVEAWIGLFVTGATPREFDRLINYYNQASSALDAKGIKSIKIDVYGFVFYYNDDDTDGMIKCIKKIIDTLRSEPDQAEYLDELCMTMLFASSSSENNSKLIPYIREIVDLVPKFKDRFGDELEESEMYYDIVNIMDHGFDELFHDLLGTKKNNCDCEQCRLEIMSMECHILIELDKYRPLIVRLQKEFPKLYALHSAFFREAMVCRDPEKMMYKRLNTLAKHDMSPVFVQDDDDDVMPVKTVRREGAKIGRNDPCICGSGKKYKKCCGQNV